MSRHLVVGRFGATDKVRVAKARDEVETVLPLIQNAHLGHGIGRALKDLRELGLTPSEIGVDLLIVAAHVHAADTRISRGSEAQDGWTREIRLVVPVSDPQLWSNATPILVRALQFLTGDRWSVGFRKRPKGSPRSLPRPRPVCCRFHSTASAYSPAAWTA